MSFVLRAAWEAVRASTKVVQGAAEATSYGLEQAQERRGAKAARRGVLGPDDPPAPPALIPDTLDYRGLARPSALSLSPWSYRLGRLRQPGGRWGLIPEEIGLPPGDLERHAAVIGPTGSGKTSSIVIPWIYGALGAGRSVIAADVRGDLWPALRRYAESEGKLNVEVYHWNYRDPDLSSSWRWLDELVSGDVVEAAVEAILGHDRGGESAGDHRRDVRTLTALLTLVRKSPGASPGVALEAVIDRERLREFLSNFRSDPSVQDLRPLLALSNDQYASAVSGVVDGLRPLAGPEVLRVTERPGIKLEMLGQRPTLLIVGSPLAGGRTATTTLGLMIALAAQRLRAGYGGQTVPTLLMLDEAPRIQERVRLSSLLSLGAGNGLAVVLVAQGVGQFSEAERDAILSDCATLIMLPGVGPPSTAYLAERLGQRAAVEVAHSIQRGSPWDPAKRGRSANNEMVAMLGHREISMPPFDGSPAIVHATTLHPRPILVDLTL